MDKTGRPEREAKQPVRNLCAKLHRTGIFTDEDAPYISDKLHDECGVFGIATSPGDAIMPAIETYNALFALQHRGQESCGIAVNNEGVLSVIKSPGLIPDVFDEKKLSILKGTSALGHVRYSAKNDINSVNSQPIMVRHINGNVALAYNGSLVNSEQLRRETELKGGIFQTTTDAEVIAYIIVRERLRTNTSEDAVLNAMQYMIGAYSLVLLNDRKLIAARDPNGYRPLCMGKLENSVVFASESCAFDAIGAEFIRDIEPGEIVVAENGNITSMHCGIKARQALCVFEFVYFARPDSVIDGVSVDAARIEAGRCLARINKTSADVVIGVPDSGIAAAQGFARESGIPYAVGLIKNRYIGRTFIKPEQSEREKSVRIKLNALRSSIEGKRVIMVDDSIVRGTTCAHIITLLREAGAKEVHVRSSAPPFLHPCYFGTDIPSRDVLIAHNRTVSEIEKIIDADSVQFLPVQDLAKITKGLKCGYCDACFTGNYAVPVPE